MIRSIAMLWLFCPNPGKSGNKCGTYKMRGPCDGVRVELPAGDGAVHPAVVAAAAVVRVEEGVDGAAPRRPPPALRSHRPVPGVRGDALAAVAARQRGALGHGAIRLQQRMWQK